MQTALHSDKKETQSFSQSFEHIAQIIVRIHKNEQLLDLALTGLLLKSCQL